MLHPVGVVSRWSGGRDMGFAMVYSTSNEAAQWSLHCNTASMILYSIIILHIELITVQ